MICPGREVITTTRSARYTASSIWCVTNMHRLAIRAPDAQQLRLHELARLRVERGERLVHEQDVRVDGQRAREVGALAHATRQLVRKVLFEPGQADQPNELVRPLHAPRACALPWTSSPKMMLSSTVRHGNSASC